MFSHHVKHVLQIFGERQLFGFFSGASVNDQVLDVRFIPFNQVPQLLDGEADVVRQLVNFLHNDVDERQVLQVEQ